MDPFLVFKIGPADVYKNKQIRTLKRYPMEPGIGGDAGSINEYLKYQEKGILYPEFLVFLCSVHSGDQ